MTADEKTCEPTEETGSGFSGAGCVEAYVILLAIIGCVILAVAKLIQYIAS